MKKINYLLSLLMLCVLTSCITTKEVKYLQPDENLVINEEGLIPYNIQEYRVTKNDIFSLNIITTPQGDASQFYSSYNTSGSSEGRNGALTGENGTNVVNESNRFNFYFRGIKVNPEGEIYVIGIGNIKAEGRTIEDIRQEIQKKVNENFLDEKTEVRLDLNGITYYILGDIETTGLTGEKVSYTSRLSIIEALAKNGGLNRTIDKKQIILQRKYPEGIKTVKLDLTKESLQNSPYYWIQNGDIIYLNTRPKSFYGFGQNATQTLTTSVSIVTTILTLILFITKI